MIGGLGGFVLPLAFGVLNDLTGLWTSCFMLLFVIAVGALAWMHLAIRHMEKEASAPALAALPELPEMQGMPAPALPARKAGAVLTDWRPEDKTFWASTGRAIARRNLWLSIPALLLSFAIWQVWSVVVAKLPLVGFKFTTDQLFWLAALPGLTGATLRIFYSFMVPIFGGRLWTTLTTWSLIIPALGIGYAVQNPDTPYVVLLILALLCGFGGGNFASSMANISFFFPKAEKGNALALNAGLGNLGVSVVQFVVPLVITMGLFGTFGGDPALVKAAAGPAPMWLQNAGFIFVPFIVLSAFGAWFGMNDIADARASFREQSGDLPAQAQLDHVLALYGHLRLLHRLFRGLSPAHQHPLPRGERALLRLPRPAGRRPRPLRHGVAGGPLRRRAGDALRLRAYDGGRLGRAVGHRHAGRNPGPSRPSSRPSWCCFFATGVGNASTFQMIPAIMAKEMDRLMPAADAEARRKQAEKEAAAITGFTSAIAAFGAFFIPKGYGTSIALTGGPEAALWAFLGFYVSCLVITWAVYTRKGGLLHDIERGIAPRATPRPAAAA